MSAVGCYLSAAELGAGWVLLANPWVFLLWHQQQCSQLALPRMCALGSLQ